MRSKLTLILSGGNTMVERGNEADSLYKAINDAGARGADWAMSGDYIVVLANIAVIHYVGSTE